MPLPTQPQPQPQKVHRACTSTSYAKGSPSLRVPSLAMLFKSKAEDRIQLVKALKGNKKWPFRMQYCREKKLSTCL